MSITGKLALTAIIATQTMLLGGCVAAVGAGAATGAAVAYDRRTAGTFIDDGIIEMKARGEIQEDEELYDYAHINVTSYNNIVLLTGEAPSEALKQRAAEVVSNIQKVRKVHNELVVAAPSSMLSRSGDTWITGKVKTVLLKTNNVDATRIKVVTENGVVYLMGLVTRAEADAATEATRKVNGVQRVVKIFEYLDG